VTRLADLDPENLAVLAARLTDQVGDDAVRAHREGIRIRPPAPGAAVLACRCGRILDGADMRRVRQPRAEGSMPAIERIACAPCAAFAEHDPSIGEIIRAIAGEGGATWSPLG
jgi:hypothetical protein